MKKKKVKRKEQKLQKLNFTLHFAYSIFIRYFLILLSSLGNLWIFYTIFTPLTIYAVFFFINLLFNSALYNNLIFIGNNSPIAIVDACVAGAAYFLLFIFNLSIPDIKINKRAKMMLFAFLSFFILNVIRIVSLTVIYIKSPDIFDISHKLSWYIGSVILVIAIWFIEVKIFKIKDIPFYTDLKSIFKYTKR